MKETHDVNIKPRTGAERNGYTVDHTYGVNKPLELFVRITARNFVRNRDEKMLDKNT